ncbi:biotin--[acetyl-CoA-carboxylase] ligase [Paenibacillus sp. GCM10012307]|uniref:Bifunctional ligase/repressor BirA n=1 Tax=Paenibacillus roseus TaxID=2798579 RepID=A0A934MSS8_9BACL|nr:biotin--[acetyl-CoA-carboxylase] ligase [Paenibacillus roseus]MBJ6363564.1 biotin--[acetyl-CoA-carboxylase] ligase [Paenibacillus roseus]
MSDELLSMFLDKEGEFLSGEAISKELNVSRTAVWKKIRKLEEQGYLFEASRKLGYKLISVPDRLSAIGMRSVLGTDRFGRQLHLYEAVDSTQTVLRKLAEEGAPEGTLVIAEQQLQGRGRMGRTWESPKGKGIWMSLLLRPNLAIHYSPQLTLLIAVALCRSLRQSTGLPIGIKWPNDLLVERKKISGILLESTAEEERLNYILAGIGISVNLEEEDYPAELLDKAISLRMLLGRKLDRTTLIAHFLKELEHLYDIYLREGFASVRTLWEALAVSLHQRVTLTTPQGVIEGVPVGLEENGALLVQLDDGQLKPVFSAEMGLPDSVS